MKRVGLYFGSFNPIHIGHLIIATYFSENTDLDEVWFVVSPQSPHKRQTNLLPENQRLEMVYRATEPYSNLKAVNIEFGLPKPNYTIDTLTYLDEKHRDKDFCLIMGEDNFKNINKWKNANEIKKRTTFVYPRLDNIKKNRTNIKANKTPIIEISASFVREQIKANKSVRALMPLEAWKYLDEMNFYKKQNNG